MFRYFLVPFLCIFCYQIYSQNLIILVSSDSIIGYKINEKPVRDFLGNVHLRQGNVDLFCNKATHYIEENRVFLSGSVKITQDTIVLISENVDYDGNKLLASAYGKIMIYDPATKLTANKGTYSFRSKTADFFGNVIYEEKKSKLKAEHIEYIKPSELIRSYENVKFETDSLLLESDTMFIYRIEEKIFSVSNVKLNGKFEPINLNSYFLFVDNKQGVTKAYGEPSLILTDTIKPESESEVESFRLDSLFVFADTILAINDGNGKTELIFISNIKLFKDNFAAIAGYGKIYRDTEEGYLKQNPILWYDSTEFKGDSVFFVLKGRSLSFVRISGNGKILSPSHLDSLYVHRILSDTINIFFSEKQLDYIFGVGNSKTNYFLKNEETQEIQLANYSSDSVKIDFHNNEVLDVVWYNNVSGEVIPEIIFKKDFEKYYDIPKNYLVLKPMILKFR